MNKFPIGFWNYAPIDKLDPSCVIDWADAGMTLPMSPDFQARPDHFEKMRAILDAAAERDMKVILCLRDTCNGKLAREGEQAYRETMTSAVSALGDHPATFGFYIGDEPGTDGFDNFCEATRIQKEIAPHLTPFGNLLPRTPNCDQRVGYLSWAAYLDAYAEKAQPDLLCYDCYTQSDEDAENAGSGKGFEMYFRNLREYCEAGQRNSLPYWTTLASVAGYHRRCPTEDDFRWQLNTALAHGTKGILYFFFYMREPHHNWRGSPVDEHYERTQSFEWLSRVNRTFLNSTAPVMQALTLTQVSHYGRSWGGVPEFDGSGRVKQVESDRTPLIISEFTDENNGEYVMVVNNSQTESTEAKLWIHGNRPCAYQVGWLGKETKFGGKAGVAVRHGEDFVRPIFWLSPGQMELYRVEDQ